MRRGPGCRLQCDRERGHAPPNADVETVPGLSSTTHRTLSAHGWQAWNLLLRNGLASMLISRCGRSAWPA